MVRGVSLIRATILVGVLVGVAALDALAAPPTLSVPSVGASATSSSSILVGWTDPNDSENGYEVQRSLSATSGFATVHNAPENARSWTNNGLSAGTRYYYRVRAVGNGNKTSDWSNTATAQTSGGGSVDTTPPNVTLFSSHNGTITSNTTVTLSASASDNVGVTRVEFYDTGVVRAVDTSPPYQTSFAVNAADNGIHYYLAVAYDAAGNIGYSMWAIVDVQISSSGSDVTPPSVSFLVPSNGTTYTSAQTVRVEASASDASGVDRVEFRLDGQLRCTETLAPYTCDWDVTSAANGSRNWTARAYDEVGNNQAVSVIVSVSIGGSGGDTTPPTVSISSPSSGTTFTGSGTVTINANASDNVGVTRVEFLRNNSLYSSDSSSPYRASWSISSSQNGNWTWTARAYDAAGNVRTSSPATYTVSIGGGGGGGDTTAPNVSITSPASGSSYTSSQTVTIAASASDDVGVTRVEFFDNGVLKRIDSAAPYTHNWVVDSSQNGSHSWTARAFDAAGNYRTSSSVFTSVSIGGGSGGGDASLVGFVPGAGTARDVAFDPSRNLAYVASDEFGLSVFDVSNPSDPVALGAPIDPFAGNEVAYSGNRAVVSSGNGLRIVDVSNPAVPVVRSVVDSGSAYQGVAISGSYAYARKLVPGNPAHTDLVTVNISSLSSPSITNQRYVAAGDDVAVANGKLYVTTGSGLQVFSLSNPAAPSPQGSVNLSGGTRDVVVSGNYAYVINNSYLHTVNVSNANSPGVVNTRSGGGIAIGLSGSRLYAVGGDDVDIYSLGNPAVPSPLGITASYNAQGVAADGTVAILASPDAFDGGLYLVQTATAGSSTLLAMVPASYGNTGVSSNGSLAVVSSADTGLWVVDVTDPALPEILGNEDITALDVAQSGSYAYTRMLVPGNPARYDLVTVSLSNPGNPSIVSQRTVAAGDDVEVANGKLYVTTGSGLQIYSLSNPSSPSAQGSVSLSGGTRDLAVAGSYAYVINNTTFHVVNVSNANSPSRVGSLSGGGTSMAHAGSYAYVVSGNDLDVISVANPSSPTLVASVPSYNAKGAVVNGNRLYLTTVDVGLVVYDVSNPASPQEMAPVPMPGPSHSGFALGSSLYVGGQAAPLSVLDAGP